jgi:hypothetical protein
MVLPSFVLYPPAPELQHWKLFADAPLVGRNVGRTMVDVLGLFFVPSGAFVLHPNFDRNIVIAWRSPIDGVVSVTGSLDSLHDCSDGLTWNLDKDSGPLDPGALASGAIGPLGRQIFESGAGGANLSSIAVANGDTLYLVVGPGDNYYCDTSRVELTVTSLAVDEP